TARILNNVVRVAGSLPTQGSRLQRRILSKMMLRQLEIVAKSPAEGNVSKGERAAAGSSSRKISIAVAGNERRFQPSSGLTAQHWGSFVARAKPPQNMTPQTARRWLLKTVDAAVARAASVANPGSGIGRVIKGLLDLAVPTASQGIVVAGEHIGDLAITGN